MKKKVLKKKSGYVTTAIFEKGMDFSGLNHSDINQEKEIEGLKIRVERLEQKIK
ncbi:MAG: hypothetical protein AAB913_01780 [Patescibacteria group bacterium]